MASPEAAVTAPGTGAPGTGPATTSAASATEEEREVRREPFRFELPNGLVIRGDAWLPGELEPGAAIVVCHGFKGFKDWGFFPWSCEEIARRTGRLAVGFNFVGSGVGEAVDRFDELERFARNTFSQELRDLEAVLDRLAVGRLGDLEVPRADRFGLLGHSRGGATCILKAAERLQVRGLVTWAAIASVDRYRSDYQARWDAGEPVEILNARTGQAMPLHRNVLDDFLANGERLNLQAAARALAVPWLIVHGTEDESVPASEARLLAEAGDATAELHLVEGEGHTFGAGHPFRGPTPVLERVVRRSADYLRRALEDS